MNLFKAVWRRLWAFDMRGPAKIGKAQLEVAVRRAERERRHLERPILSEEERATLRAKRGQPNDDDSGHAAPGRAL